MLEKKLAVARIPIEKSCPWWLVVASLYLEINTWQNKHMTKYQGKPVTASFTCSIKKFLLATAHMFMLQGKLAVASFPIEK